MRSWLQRFEGEKKEDYQDIIAYIEKYLKSYEEQLSKLTKQEDEKE